MLAVAAACDWLTTFGTTVPTVMVSCTVLPNGRSVPAAGFWLMTVPTATVVLLPFDAGGDEVRARQRRHRRRLGQADDVRHRPRRDAPPPLATLMVTPSLNSSRSMFSSVSMPVGEQAHPPERRGRA